MTLCDGYSKRILSMLENTENCYLLVFWPDVQKYMDRDWFLSEAILEAEGRFGAGSYFIPLTRIFDYAKNS